MIFLTLGTQLPFDRLVQIVDQLAAQVDEEIFGQIGHGTYRPAHFAYVERLTPSDFAAKFAAARLVIGHAGIGTILSGQKYAKPVLLMARQSALGEHRNDHQSATAAQMRKKPGVHVFETLDELRGLVLRPDLPAMTTDMVPERERLITGLRAAIFSRT